MFFLKKWLLVAATLSLVGTPGILPAQAIALNFRSYDDLVRGSLFNTPSDPSRIDGWFSFSGKDWSISATQLYGRITSTVETEIWQARAMGLGINISPNNPPSTLPNLPPNLHPTISVFGMTSWMANVGFFCVSKDCSQAEGSISVEMSYRNAPGIEYHWSLGPLGLVLIKEEQPIRPKIPEPSLVSALLLLGCGWLLHSQLKTSAISLRL